MLDDARINLYTQVKIAFFEILRRQDEAKLADENHALPLQIRNRVKLRFEVGEAPRYELVKSEAELLTAESAANSAAVRIVQAKHKLRTLLGAPMNEQFDIIHVTPAAAALPTLGKLREELYE